VDGSTSVYVWDLTKTERLSSRAQVHSRARLASELFAEAKLESDADSTISPRPDRLRATTASRAERV
jgi:hypothetical protein